MIVYLNLKHVSFLIYLMESKTNLKDTLLALTQYLRARWKFCPLK